MSNLEETLVLQMKAAGYPCPEREYRFHPTRRWRFDFAFPAVQLAVEIEGGIYSARSGHRSVTGMRRDMEKYNEAALLGWRVLRFSEREVRNGDALQIVERALK